jgi:hypothetical protein
METIGKHSAAEGRPTVEEIYTRLEQEKPQEQAASSDTEYSKYIDDTYEGLKEKPQAEAEEKSTEGVKLPPPPVYRGPEGSAVSSSTLPETSKLAPEAPRVPTSEATTDTPPEAPAQETAAETKAAPKAPETKEKAKKSKHENEASQAELDAEINRATMEAIASLELSKSRKLRNTIKERSDEVVKGTEKLSGKSRDARFKARNAIEQRKIRKVSEKLDRYNEKAISAKFAFRRRKFAAKARAKQNRLKFLNNINQARVGYHNDEVKARTERREHRAKNVKEYTEKMIFKEYKVAELLKNEREKLKRQMRLAENPDKRNKLKERLNHLKTEKGEKEVGRELLAKMMGIDIRSRYEAAKAVDKILKAAANRQQSNE